jgi:hypothetical protein
LTNSGQGIAEPAKVEELKGIAKTIAQNEEELAREWAQLVRSFQPNNSSPVDATKFNTRLVALQSAVIALKDYVLNQNNALNLSDSTEIQIPNNFGNETKTVLDLTVHSVEVFSRPMIGDLDYFRQAYFDQEELKSLVAISNQCLEVKP